MYELLKEAIKPELAVLIPVLYLMGMALKNSEVPNKHIPWILGTAGVVLALAYLGSTTELSGWQSVLSVVFAGITQGALTAGASVYVNQIIKQAGETE